MLSSNSVPPEDLFSGIWCHEVWQVFSEVSEERVASMFVENVGEYLPLYTALHPTRQYDSKESKICHILNEMGMLRKSNSVLHDLPILTSLIDYIN
jgi:hypothetical protein